ncbi:hypothetical protein [Polynucleobacter sp. MWH-UH23A]|uniref:hypothetical protein n=1 Tax=Polynucleobacter sp. MWH-UH23A TaxID=1855613 RepID=UPI003364D7C5
MKRVVPMLILLISLISSSAASPTEDMYGTYKVSFQPVTVQGNPQFCLLNFTSIIKSSAYERDANYSVSGSLGMGITENRSNIIVSLKVVNYKINPIQPRAKAIPKRPYFAYLVAPSGVNNSKGYLGGEPSESPGGLTSGFNFDDAAMEIFTQIIDSKKVSVAFNLGKGGMDILAPLDLTVSDVNDAGIRIKNNNAVTDFKKCMVPILREASQNMERLDKQATSK